MSNSQNKSGFASVIIVLLVILFVLAGIGSCSDSGGLGEGADTVRCSYCGKVIRSDGRNIHATPVYNGGVLKCDYCGHNTKY